MFIHLFGAYFGLVVSFFVARPHRDDDRAEHSDYFGSTFAFVGTLLLVALFPSFNAAFAVPGTQYRLIGNTVLAMIVSIGTVLALSRCLFFTGNKFGVREVQRATLSGAVIIASATSYMVPPIAAIVLGFVAGITSVIMSLYVVPMLRRSRNLGDTTGVQALHGVPGILGALIGCIVVAVSDSFQASANDDGDSALMQEFTLGNTTLSTNFVFDVPPQEIFNRSGSEQAPWSLAIFAVTLCITFFGGLITALILYVFKLFFNIQTPAPDQLADDRFWHVPQDYAWSAGPT